MQYIAQLLRQPPFGLAQHDPEGRAGESERRLTRKSSLISGLAAATERGERYFEAELYRLRGEILLAQESTEHGARSRGQRAKRG